MVGEGVFEVVDSQVEDFLEDLVVVVFADHPEVFELDLYDLVGDHSEEQVQSELFHVHPLDPIDIPTIDLVRAIGGIMAGIIALGIGVFGIILDSGDITIDLGITHQCISAEV